MSAPKLELLGLVTGLSDGKGPRLQLATPAGLVREVPLNRAQLNRLIERAAGALMVLDKEERRESRGPL